MDVSRRIPVAISVFVFAGTVLAAQIATSPRPIGAGQQSAANPPGQQNRAKVSGVVVNATSGQSLRKALVSLLGGNTNRGNNPQRGQQAQPAQQAQPGQAAAGQPQDAQNGQTGPRGGGGGGTRSVTTGDDGVFTFDDVVPGTYRIRVERDGFLTQEYGQRSWTGSGVPVTLQAGQALSGVTFQLLAGGTIAGRILDENLEPVVGLQVQSLTFVYQNGTRTLVSERQVQTNDLGEYRLYWLTPGDHYVNAIPGSRRGGLVQAAQTGPQRGRGGQVPPVPGGEDSREASYAPMFYPGSIDPETAVPVRVAAATEVRGIDFVLRPIATARISGRVLGVDIPVTNQQAQQQAQQSRGRGGNDGDGRGGGRGGRGGGIQVLLSRVGTSVGGGRGGGGRGGGRGGRGGLNGIASLAPVNADGTFAIDDVIPGSYNLIAVQQAQGQVYSTRTQLEVAGGDITGINLAVRPGVDVPGQIYIEGTAPANFQMNRLRVNLTSQDGIPFIGNSNAQVDDAGKFTLTSVPAMSYRVNVQGLPTGAYLIAGKFGNVDALGEPLQVDQSGSLALQVGFSPGQVAVGVADSVGQPFSGAITVLIPSVRNRTDLYRTATSDQSGQVVFSGVAPGDYKIIAWEDVPQGAYLNADFVAPYEDRAQSIHVDRASSTAAQVKVIPRDQR